MNILIAEDDQDVRNLICLHLGNEGFLIYEAEDGIGALDILHTEKIDLAILDVMMPKLDGFSVLRKMRSFSNIPVIFVTARTEDSDKILGLGLGADDYVVKPFSAVELMARVHAQLRRYYEYINSQVQDEYVVGNLKLNSDSCEVLKGDMKLILNPKEYKIMEMLMKNPGRVFTKRQLYENVWEDSYLGDDNTIMVYISHLRDKIEDNPQKPLYLKTIRGIGYKLEKNI